MPLKPGGGAWWSSPPLARGSHEECAPADVRLPLAQASARPKPSRRSAPRRRATERGADARDRLGSRLPRRRLGGHRVHPGGNARSAWPAETGGEARLGGAPFQRQGRGRVHAARPAQGLQRQLHRRRETVGRASHRPGNQGTPERKYGRDGGRFRGHATGGFRRSLEGGRGGGRHPGARHRLPRAAFRRRADGHGARYRADGPHASGALGRQEPGGRHAQCPPHQLRLGLQLPHGHVGTAPDARPGSRILRAMPAFPHEDGAGPVRTNGEATSSRAWFRGARRRGQRRIQRGAQGSPAAPIPGAEGGGEQDSHLCRLQDARRDRGQDFPGRRRCALPGHCRADERGPLEARRGAQPLLDISAPPDANGTGGAVAAFRGGGGDRSGIARRAQVMAELDLIPADYAQRQTLLRRVKRFVAAAVSLACLLVLARGMLQLLTSVETGEVARLQGQERLWAQSEAKVEEYRKQKLATQNQLLALDELRGRDRLRLFLKAVDAAHVENVWFDEIRYYRRDNLPAGDSLPGGARAGIIVVPEKNVPAPGTALKAPDIEQRVGIVGHAINHARLAQFMRRLESQRGIADVSLVDTSPRSYPNALVIDLKLSLLVDEKARGRP